MGLLFSRFKKKLSTRDVLEKIESEMKIIEEFKQDTQERQKRVTRRLVVFTLLTYIASFTVFFFVERVRKQTLVFITAVIGFAFLAWIFRKMLRWHYSRQIQLNEEKFIELKKKKQKILEEVMDTETYKVAKEILDKFGDKPARIESKIQSTPLPQRPSPPGTELRKRNPEPRPTPAKPQVAPQTPFQPQHPPQQMHSAVRDVRLGSQHLPSRQLPRPVLPRERGVMDRVLDYLVGDGPNQRFALICRHCGGHNGMSLQEEFEYIGYHCCYCFQWNPPRKQRLAGPRLPQPPPPPPKAPSQVGESREVKMKLEETQPLQEKSGEESPKDKSDENKEKEEVEKVEEASSGEVKGEAEDKAVLEHPESSDEETESLK